MYKNQKEIRLFPKLPHSSPFHGLERFQERLLIFKFSSAEFYEPASFPWEIMACASSLLFFILCVEGGFYSTHYVPLFLVADLRLEAASTCLGPTFGKGKEGNLWSLLANASTTQLSLGLLTFTPKSTTTTISDLLERSTYLLESSRTTLQNWSESRSKMCSGVFPNDALGDFQRTKKRGRDCSEGNNPYLCW